HRPPTEKSWPHFRPSAGTAAPSVAPAFFTRAALGIVEKVSHDYCPRSRLLRYGGASGSGGPPGKRNGQYRHGERTKAAIAERRGFSALLKKLRAGLT